MTVLPACTVTNSVLESQLVRRAEEGDLIKLVVFPVAGALEDTCYVAAYFRPDLTIPFYWVDALNSTRPKIFDGHEDLFAKITTDFEGIPVQFRTGS